MSFDERLLLYIALYYSRTHKCMIHYICLADIDMRVRQNFEGIQTQ